MGKKDNLLSKWCQDNWISNSNLTKYTEIYPKWFIALNAKPKTIKLLKENIGL